MGSIAGNQDGKAVAGNRRRSRVFDYLVNAGFIINMIVVAAIVGYWIAN